jgi:hypothetical protein
VTETLSFKVPREIKLRLRAIAKARKIKPSTILRDALEKVLNGATRDEGATCGALSKDLFEKLERRGPKDLATNARHMKGFGKWRR